MTASATTKTLTFEHYADPGHSWIKVSKLHLKKYLGPGWRHHFTPYSYEKKCNAFLEEDDDYGRWVAVLKHHGIEPRLRTYQAQRSSIIRNYPPLATNWKHGDPVPAPDAFYPTA